jgi:hypothetical protein
MTTEKELEEDRIKRQIEEDDLKYDNNMRIRNR